MPLIIPPSPIRVVTLHRLVSTPEGQTEAQVELRVEEPQSEEPH